MNALSIVMIEWLVKITLLMIGPVILRIRKDICLIRLYNTTMKLNLEIILTLWVCIWVYTTSSLSLIISTGSANSLLRFNSLVKLSDEYTVITVFILNYY